MLSRISNSASLRAARAGYTIIEMLIALALFSLVMTGVVSVVVRQQRFQIDARRVLDAQSDLRQVADLLSSELRALGTGAGDITAFTPRSVDFRVVTGATVICTINAARTVITVPPENLAARNALTSWRARPIAGDFMFVFDEGAQPVRGDDLWRLHTLTLAPTAGVCAPANGGYTRSVAEGNASITLTVNPALSPTITPGAPIRFYRTARYELSAANDGLWYLAYSECPGSCGTPESVAGPFRAPSQSGLNFTFLNQAGLPAATPAEIAQIELVLRTPSASAGHERNPLGRGAFADSLHVSVAVRNRT